jgi:hypothetical protein
MNGIKFFFRREEQRRLCAIDCTFLILKLCSICEKEEASRRQEEGSHTHPRHATATDRTIINEFGVFGNTCKVL